MIEKGWCCKKYAAIKFWQLGKKDYFYVWK